MLRLYYGRPGIFLGLLWSEFFQELPSYCAVFFKPISVSGPKNKIAQMETIFTVSDVSVPKLFYFTPWTPSVSSQKKQLKGWNSFWYNGPRRTTHGDALECPFQSRFFKGHQKGRKKIEMDITAKQTKKENLWTSENGYHKVIRWPSSKLLGDLSCTHYAYQKLKLWKVTSRQLSRED